MNTKQITHKFYDISINFSEFADDSFENKLTTLGDALNKKTLSPKMFMDKVYGHTLSQSDYDAELDYLEKHANQDFMNPFEQAMNPGTGPQLTNEEEEQEPFN